jgi:hypothetical protein
MGKRLAPVVLIVALFLLPACLSGGKLIQADEISVYGAGRPDAPLSLSNVQEAKITQALNNFLVRLDTRSDVTYTDTQIDTLDMRVRARLDRQKVFDAPIGKLRVQQIAVVWMDDAPAALLRVDDESLWRVYSTSDASARETLARVVDEARASVE